MIKFRRTNAPPLQGELWYSRNDRGFNFDPDGLNAISRRTRSMGTTSVLIQTLQIELEIESGLLLFPWGYFPLEAVPSANLQIGSFVSGGINAQPDKPFIAMISEAIGRDKEWSAQYDKQSGWCRITRRGKTEPMVLVEFARGCVAALQDDDLVALWLKPDLR